MRGISPDMKNDNDNVNFGDVSGGTAIAMDSLPFVHHLELVCKYKI